MIDVKARLDHIIKKEGTNISWATFSWNPWIGCQKVSPACDHCYAEDLATARLGVAWGPGAERRRTAPGNWSKPPRWNRLAEEAGVRLTVFCASLADWADNAVDDAWRADLAALIIATPWLDWMLLTKRIGNARRMLEAMFPDGVPPNVALGLTIANQEEADRDLPRAIAIKHGLGIKRLFVSGEPLLGPLDMTRYLAHIDLLIVGGESGKDARIMQLDWVRSLRDQTKAAGVPFHFKQWGEWIATAEIGFHGFERCRRVDIAPHAYLRVGVRRAGHTIDGFEHREHFR